MLAFQGGDEPAFAALVQRNQGKVFSVVSRFVGRNADAEDLVQEVFLRVFRSAGRYKVSARFSTWLYRIAVNVSLNALRARKKLKVMQFPSVTSDEDSEISLDLPDADTPSPQATLHRRELQLAVEQAVEKLPDKQRAAIILNKYENMSYDDIAAVISCSPQAVKSLLSRARESLRELLREHMTD